MSNEKDIDNIAVISVLTSRYEAQGIVLAESILKYCNHAQVYLFCLDDQSYSIIKNYDLKNLIAIHYNDIETKSLNKIKKERKIEEFCWTLKPYILQHTLKIAPYLKWACYADTDMMAFNDISSYITRVSETKSAIFCPHAFKYQQFLSYNYVVGEFNAGFVAFKNNDIGLDILGKWRKLCTQSCFRATSPDNFADQYHLEHLYYEYRSDISAGYPSLNCAPWNIGRETLDIDDNGFIKALGQSVYLYHFQGFKMHHPNMYEAYTGNLSISKSVKKNIYTMFFKQLVYTNSKIYGHNKHGFFRTLFNKHIIKRLLTKRNMIFVQH